MSIGEYILQVTPKRIEFKLPTTYIKVSTSLTFGNLEYISPYARFIRSNQGSFYGERLKLTNSLNSDATFTVIAIGKMKEQVVMAKIHLNIRDMADKDQPTEHIYQDQEIKFQYEVLVLEKEISNQDYEQTEINRQDNIQTDSEPILINILSSDNDNEQRAPDANFDPNSPEPPSTPRLREEIPQNPDMVTFKELKIEQSPIINRVQSQKTLGLTLRSSLRRESAILSPRSDRSGNSGFSNKQLDNIHTPKVTFVQPPKQPQRMNISIRSILYYFGISAISFYAGVCARLHTKN